VKKIAILITLLLCCSCTVQNHNPINNSEPDNKNFRKLQKEHFWQSICFKHKYNTDALPAWHMDVLLMQEIVGPVLEKNKKDIELWRIHRRANNDKAGHQFTFWIYTKKKLADKIYTDIKTNSLLEQLQTEGYIEKVFYSNNLDKPFISDTSDKRWSMNVQISWTKFIQGVCEMWYDQGKILSNANRPDNDLNKLIAYYKEVNELINLEWHYGASHAYFHHLNAIYGYVPVNIAGTPVRF